MAVELVHVGFGSFVALNRVLAILPPDSAPIKRLAQEARERGQLVDATYGRKTKAVIVMDSGQVTLSAIHPETIAGRHGRWAAGATSRGADEEEAEATR